LESPFREPLIANVPKRALRLAIRRSVYVYSLDVACDIPQLSDCRCRRDDFCMAGCESPVDATRPMIVSISFDAESDIAEGYWFYERQSPGLGDYSAAA
jgi:hypothetical protein